MKIQMVDLQTQYQKIKEEIDQALLTVLMDGTYINGSDVLEFSESLSNYLGGCKVIPCANGTDALQIAFMSLGLQPGDEIIVPAFTYVATAEVIGLLGLKPVLVDVDASDFNLNVAHVRTAITSRTKAIVPVHLFGQCANMGQVLELANEYGLYVIEDAAQAFGADYYFRDGSIKKAGTIGHIGCTSFFPSKNLGCYGDGGAIFTNDEHLAAKIKMIANHGQEKKYIHKYIGVNSRLDTIQASILKVKLKYFKEYILARQYAAEVYDRLLSDVNQIIIPQRNFSSTHVFHQYTITIRNGLRDGLKKYLEEKGIPTMVYYPVPLNEQEAFSQICSIASSGLEQTKQLCNSVLSLPIHTEMNQEQQIFISGTIKDFFN